MTFQETVFQFIAIELDLGETLADVAATEYAQDRPARGQEVLAKVEQAWAEAERRLQYADGRGWDTTALWHRLHLLNKKIAGLGLPRP